MWDDSLDQNDTQTSQSEKRKAIWGWEIITKIAENYSVNLLHKFLMMQNMLKTTRNQETFSDIN